MHIDKFSNYLLALLLFLQLIGYILLFSLWSSFGMRGLFFATIVYFMICSLALFYMQRVNVYDDRGNKQKLSDIFTNVVTVAIWLIISTIVLTIITMISGYSLAVKHNRDTLTGILIPVLSAGVLFGSIAFISTST